MMNEKSLLRGLCIHILLKRGFRMAKLSKIIALATVALLSISVFAVLATVSADSDHPGPPWIPIQPIQPVKVELNGSINLEWYKTSTTIKVAQNFTANVPPAITAGTYDAKFAGFARVDATNIAFNGMIMTRNGTFLAVFEVPTPTGTQTGESWASGNVTIVISAKVTPPPISVELIQVAGHVTKWQGANASGRLDADAKITNDSSVQNTSDVSVSWSLWAPPTTSSTSSNAPWNFSFYDARLIKTTTVALNYSGHDLYVSGLWNVVNVTSGGNPAHAPDFKRSATYVVQNATGNFTSDLKVHGNWTLSINGVGNVTGSVTSVRRHAQRILEGDIFDKGSVDIFDLVYVARLVGATPGVPQWGGPSNFENVEKADVNHDFQVDIYDLVTVATEIGQTG
jgi:hypothetical protein